MQRDDGTMPSSIVIAGVVGIYAVMAIALLAPALPASAAGTADWLLAWFAIVTAWFGQVSRKFVIASGSSAALGVVLALGAIDDWPSVLVAFALLGSAPFAIARIARIDAERVVAQAPRARPQPRIRARDR